MKRRNFIKNLLATPTLLNFSLFNEISAQTANDYKALIYIFLQGGNDSLNMIIPMDTTYLDYQKTRSAIALSKESVLSLNDYHF